MGHNYGSPLTILFTFLMASGSYMFARAKTFTIVNDCKETVWPGIITHSDNFSGGGFALKPGQSAVYNAPAGWSGRIWARTGCNFSHDTGTGTCQTGSCGTQLNCTGPSSPPNTIAEITVGGDTDFYDVSLVNGFNLPIYILPLKGKGNCSIAGCDGDLRQSCPSQLAVKENGTVIACKSACDEFDTDEYCCRGSYADPAVCKPTNYSMSFKQVCPAASSYALDDRSTIIACSGSEYIVAFCASRNQTVCSYHDNKLECNTSKGLKAFSQSWWSLILTLSLLILNKLLTF